ncbi:MAG: TetR/AcrR family transcriptional regulator [Neisseria sp.]|uniref:TetR/AcrR family transcriptional regulator n=1 Tax=Neisseria sp. TaxID=192066 RepID=UPI0026DB60CD|nr:TetR/AcrR family transcriptional regulator [Neisseria sp.]MDO4640269.1 TetR/AcrR family transcriptional regulator [Neisseria sp.]
MAKHDLRVQKTLKAIENALIQLLAEKTYLEISVQELIERAMINRKTFYTYYSGKDDLVGQLIQNFLLEYQSLIDKRQETANLKELLQNATPFFFERRQLVLALWKIETKRHHLYADMQQMLKQGFIELANRRTGIAKERDFQATLFATLALNSAKYFFERGEIMPVSNTFVDWHEMLEIVELK